MDKRQLTTFVKVAERLSFTQAAMDLSFAQSSVTAQVKRLEHEVGNVLFDRLPGTVRLTPAGERFLPYARQILELMEEAQASTGSLADPAGTLVVGTMESISSYRLQPLVEYIHLRFPKVHLSMRPSLCEQTVESIRRGTFDCGFFMDAPARFHSLHTETLCHESLVLVASSTHPLAGRPCLSVEDLRRERVLGTEPGCAYRDRLEDELSCDGGEPFPILEFGTIESIKRSVTMGLGIALLPEVAVDGELREGSIVALDWQPPFRMSTQIAWRSGQPMSAALRVLVESALKVVAEQTQTEPNASGRAASV